MSRDESGDFLRRIRQELYPEDTFLVDVLAHALRDELLSVEEARVIIVATWPEYLNRLSHLFGGKYWPKNVDSF